MFHDICVLPIRRIAIVKSGRINLGHMSQLQLFVHTFFFFLLVAPKINAPLSPTLVPLAPALPLPSRPPPWLPPTGPWPSPSLCAPSCWSPPLDRGGSLCRARCRCHAALLYAAAACVPAAASTAFPMGAPSLSLLPLLRPFSRRRDARRVGGRGRSRGRQPRWLRKGGAGWGNGG